MQEEHVITLDNGVRMNIKVSKDGTCIRIRKDGGRSTSSINVTPDVSNVIEVW